MRKQSKIISLILVLALLLSMLVLPGVTAVADTSATGSESGTEAQSEAFTPTATWTDGGVAGSDIRSSVANNIMYSNSADLANWNEETIHASKVTVGDNAFGMLTALADKPTGNHYVNLGVNSQYLTTETETDGKKTYTPTGYYVVDFDLATDSEMIPGFDMSVTIRSTSSAGATEWLDASSVPFVNFIENDGTWQHVTMVGDVANNKIYTFVNGALVDDTKYAYDGPTEYSGANHITLSGLRINMPGTATMAAGASLAYDNVALRVFGANDAIASALAAGTLGGYENVISAPAEEKLPAIATVDGTEYYNVGAISARLAYLAADDVELLRDYAGTINISADCTVETNGLSFVQRTDFTVADGATVTTSGTVVTVDAPHVSSIVESGPATNSSAILSAVVHDSAKDFVTSYGDNFGETADKLSAYIVNEQGEDNQYIDIRPGASFSSTTSHEHLNMPNIGSNLPQYVAGTYFILDYDVFADYEFLSEFYITINTRSASNATGSVGGAAHYFSDYGLVPGRWNHITEIYKVDDNTGYVYVDGRQTLSITSALHNQGAGKTATPYYFQSVRFNLNTRTTVNTDQNFAIDNFSVRMNYTDSEIASYYASPNIEGWSGAIEHEETPLPTLATVDGVEYKSTAALNAVLSLAYFEPREVVFYRDAIGTVNVDCDANINTNGYNVSLAYVEGATVSEDGNIITVDAPNKAASVNANAGSSDKSAIVAATFASDVPGNAYTTSSFVAFSNLYSDATAAYTQSYLQTNSYTGDTYWILLGDTVTDASNSYFDFGLNKIISYDANASQYFIYDFDMAALTEASSFNLGTVTRTAASVSGWSVNSHNAKKVAERGEIGYFQHVTIVKDVNNNKSYMYINGELVETLSTGFVQADYHTQFMAGTLSLKADGIRFGSNSTMNVALDNMAVRYVSSATDYSAAFAAGNLGSFAVYSEGYDFPEIAPVALVDGELVPGAGALEEALAAKEYGSDEVDVQLVADISDTVTVSCNASVNTNGYTHNLVAANGVVFTDLGNNLLSYYATSLGLELQNNHTNILAAIKYSANDNIFTSVQWMLYTTSATGRYKAYLATDKVTGNKYAYFGNEDYDGTTNSYSEIQSITKVYYDSSKSQYMVYDFDIAIETDENVSFEAVARNADPTASPDHNPGPSVNTILLGYKNGDFQHITQVIDIDNNLAYTFVNGKLQGSYKAYKDEANALYRAGSDYVQFDGIRIGTRTLNQYSVDNVYIRKVDVASTDTATDSIKAALAVNDITKWSGAITSIGSHVAPVGEVDGNYYYTTADLGAALADSSTEHDSEIMREISDEIKVSSLGTLTNKVGANVSAGYGYRLTDNGDGTYTFTIETRTGNIVIKINGVTEYDLDLLYGADVVDYLADQGIIEGELLFDTDGNIYTGWPDSFVPVEGDATYDLTATLYEKMFVVLVNGAVKDYEDSETGFFTAIKTNETSVIILNKDMTITLGKASNSFNGNHTVRLNGHTITTDVIDSYTVEKTNDDGTTTTTTYTPKNNPNHMFSIGAVSGNLEFVGPGTLYDCSRENTTQFVFCGYDYTGTVIFKDMNIIGSGSLATMRGGNLTFDNVDIDFISTQGAAFAQFGEEYNGSYSKNNGTLTFVDCNVNARHHRASWGKFINIKNIPSSPNIVYTVNIIDSVMNIGYGSEFAIESSNANTVINITGSEIRSNSLFDHGYQNSSGADVVFLGTVNVGEGTKFANAANTAYDFVNIGDGLQLVNSGDLNAPYLYTSEYATVTWADGTVEYWADGTYPTNPNYKLADVEKVVAGESYSFSEIDSLGFAIKANLTLTSGIQFNLYVPTSAAITAVNIDGINYSIEGANVVAIEGVEHYVFAYDILPSEAAGVFTFAISTADWTVAREMSVLDYANLVYASAPAAKTLMSNILKYIHESHAYFAVYSENLDAISSALRNNSNSVVAPAVKESNTSDISGVIKSASLNIESTLKFRFNIVAGADISDLTFTVDGKAVEYTIGDGYVEVELRAYDLLKDITISVGGSTGTYNLYAYYDYIVTTAAGYNGTSVNQNDNDATRAYKVQALIKALCSYAAAAADYHG